MAPHLLRAWRLTEYCACGVPIRIGRRVPDAVFAGARARSATLLTAWNPRSRRRPDGWNRRVQRLLRERLRRFAVAEAAGTLRCWHEAMLLVGGDPRPVRRIAAVFRQAGVVELRYGQLARLRILGHAMGPVATHPSYETACRRMG